MNISEAGLKIVDKIKELSLPNEYGICVLIYNTKEGGLVVTSNANKTLEYEMCKLAVEAVEKKIPIDTFITIDKKD